LNFLQHVKTLLAINWRCAIVVPDDVLFFDARPAQEIADDMQTALERFSAVVEGVKG
jgi:type I restriction-modification system DNA methylase subunit